jgi:hypothetical protein
MEEENSQSPEHQFNPAKGTGDIYYHLVAAKEEADRMNRAAAIAEDEQMAHRLYMEELMGMEEWQLRDMVRPSSTAAEDLPLDFIPASSRAGVGANTAAPGKFGAGTTTTSGFKRPRDFATTPATQTVLSKASASVIPSAGCGATPPPARPTVDPANDDPVSKKRRALLAEANSAIIFAGMEEGHNYSWYDQSMILPDEDDEEPDEVEVQSLSESLQQCLPRPEPSCNPAAAATVAAPAEGHEFSLLDFCHRWDVNPSDVNPDEPDQSTKVPPLADHEVPTFDCGICTNTLPVFDIFHGLPCKHRFCAPCMTTYVEDMICASDHLPIVCPDPACGGGVLHPEKCKKAIDYAAFGDWGVRLAEGAIPPGKRAYCLNQRCGLLVETSDEGEPVGALCPACGNALVRKRSRCA